MTVAARWRYKLSRMPMSYTSGSSKIEQSGFCTFPEDGQKHCGWQKHDVVKLKFALKHGKSVSFGWWSNLLIYFAE